MTSSNGNIYRWTVNSPQKGQWRGALMFSLICAWMNDWVNNREAGDLRRHRAQYDVTVMYRPKRTLTLSVMSTAGWCIRGSAWPLKALRVLGTVFHLGQYQCWHSCFSHDSLLLVTVPVSLTALPVIDAYKQCTVCAERVHHTAYAGCDTVYLLPGSITDPKTGKVFLIKQLVVQFVPSVKVFLYSNMKYRSHADDQTTNKLST